MGGPGYNNGVPTPERVLVGGEGQGEGGQVSSHAICAQALTTDLCKQGSQNSCTPVNGVNRQKQSCRSSSHQLHVQ